MCRRRRSDRHFRQNFAATGGRSLLPSSISFPHLTQVIAVLFGAVKTQNLCPKPIDRFLSIPPVTHALAVIQPVLPDVFRGSPFAVLIWLGLEGVRCVLVQMPQVFGFGRLFTA